ncbi:MAG TPA: fatty acid desaturase [Polyangiaceae bacterium]|nr:fatty acid desaturase [Polyangiaceae bacterium]
MATIEPTAGRRAERRDERRDEEPGEPRGERRAAPPDPLAEELERLARRVRAELGDDDLRHIRRVARASKLCGRLGRLLIVTSLEPAGFLAGVLALAAHKVLEAVEIGHSVLHGAYDELDPKGRFHSDKFAWEMPIDERAWHRTHNLRHHPNTNVVGRDADVALGFVRLAAESPHRPLCYAQLPALLFGGLPNFALLMQMQFSGVFDLFFDNGLPSRFNYLPDRSPRTALRTLAGALKKPARYYGKNYLLYPLLAGPLAGKLVVGTWLAERLRDVWVGLIILCGHTGPDAVAYPEGTRAKSKGQYYRMQIEATNNFEVPAALSLFAGALDRQIEHHLFPDLPPNRVREIAPEVRRICERHGVRYHSAGLARAVLRSLAHVAALSLPARPAAAR